MTPDTAERAPNIDAVMADVVRACTSRRHRLRGDDRLLLPVMVHDTIAALSARGWLTDEARVALGMADGGAR